LPQTASSLMSDAVYQSLVVATRGRLRTIAEQDRALKAWVYLDDELLHEHHPGPLDSLEFGVKDVIDVAGMPTRCGSPATSDAIATSDAACVGLLRAAGALPIGKTATAEFAHVTPGPTRNPVHQAHTPGGSSSGSAAAVAAGMVPFALGTQTGGSMIRPAAYCGVVGFKPTFGLVPRNGMRVMCPSLDVIGWHSKDVRLAARVADVLLPKGHMMVGSSKPLRIGFMAAHPGYTLEHSAIRTLENARADLERVGHAVIPVRPPAHTERLLEAHGIITHYELSRSLRELLQGSERLLSPALREAIQKGASIPNEQYAEELKFREAVIGSWGDEFSDVDLVLTSSVLGPAPLGLDHTGQSGFNKAWSFLGWPCVHLPTSTDDCGLPMGVLLVARPGLDQDLLSWAEMLHPAIDRRPTSCMPVDRSQP